MKFWRKPKPKQTNILAPISIHASVLENRVRLWRFRMTPVIADQQVFDSHPSTKLVSPDK
ncbi:hypothetical protein LA23_11610 [Xanthomonas oryzae pv. oryzae]|nr:hypothetical protein LA23_11610 [Xanthomonas oryzae pv. oryzae]